jgi:hypothetical protein
MSPSSIVDRIAMEQKLQMKKLVALLTIESSGDSKASEICQGLRRAYDQQLEQMLYLKNLSNALARRELTLEGNNNAANINNTEDERSLEFKKKDPLLPGTESSSNTNESDSLCEHSSSSSDESLKAAPKKGTSVKKRRAKPLQHAAKRQRMSPTDSKFMYNWREIIANLKKPLNDGIVTTSSWFNKMKKAKNVYEISVEGVDKPVWVIKTKGQQAEFESCRRNFNTSVAKEYNKTKGEKAYGSTSGKIDGWSYYFFAPKIGKKINKFL